MAATDIDLELLWGDLLKHYSSEGTGGPFITAAHAAGLIHRAAELVEGAAEARQATARGVGATPAQLLPYAKEATAVVKVLDVYVKFARHWRKDIAFEDLEGILFNLRACADTCAKISREKWTEATMREAGL